MFAGPLQAVARFVGYEAPQAPAEAPASEKAAPKKPAKPEPTFENWGEQDAFRRSELVTAIQEDPKLQRAFKDWGGLSQEARLDALRRISEKQGEIWGFRPDPIRYDPALMDPGEKPGVLGYHNDKGIAISGVTLGRSIDAVNTVTHEQAHEFQHVMAEKYEDGELKRGDVYRPVARRWAKNFDDYSAPGDPRYPTQPVEAHAFDVGGAIAGGVFYGK